ncbi:MAG TPA: hypothetical protein DIT99_04850 [Candidatus Latescibacteria bacterium]|nr:hypothetical protein [Candidatus Latescibacterota bacterium]
MQVVTRSAGEMVGEFALIDDHTRSATIKAVSDASLLQWTRHGAGSIHKIVCDRPGNDIGSDYLLTTAWHPF